jgi:hypothetical protein
MFAAIEKGHSLEKIKKLVDLEQHNYGQDYLNDAETHHTQPARRSLTRHITLYRLVTAIGFIVATAPVLTSPPVCRAPMVMSFHRRQKSPGKST